ncbi:uncharacterized protein [Aegilops tauschii subsp. strangulata]|uniref:uncharacterized protein isoform X2 n=1 Tax=Triticum aestivum TaxID=4565 RepID=UPI001ABCEC13|nr:uncharacterized protein LOC123096359 isoform X2 [Triticum aestivum]XP_045083383.1 uncharacterized protein LOC109749726 isoform X2 [Aegilops tauschii subsp. strangulata]
MIRNLVLRLGGVVTFNSASVLQSTVRPHARAASDSCLFYQRYAFYRKCENNDDLRLKNHRGCSFSVPLVKRRGMCGSGRERVTGRNSWSSFTSRWARDGSLQPTRPQSPQVVALKSPPCPAYSLRVRQLLMLC